MEDKVKVYDLANELGVRSIELVDRIKSLGISVKSHMSTLEHDEVDKVRALYGKKPANVESKDDSKQKTSIIRRKAKIEPKIEKEEVVVPVSVTPLSSPEIEPVQSSLQSHNAPQQQQVNTTEKTSIEQKVSAPVNVTDNPQPPVVEKKEEKSIQKPKIFTMGAKLSTIPVDPEDDKNKKDGRKRVKSSKREGRLEIINVIEMKKHGSGRAVYGMKKKPQAGREQKQTLITTPKAIKRRIKLTSSTITVADLAKEMGIKVSELIQKLMGLGVMATINNPIDLDTAILVAGDFSYEVEYVGFDENSLIEKKEDQNEEDLLPKPPVVTFMGHVDHGKTSLLDAIRQTKVADKEAGGITQHIGAYVIDVNGKAITFIDTPGHEAFTAMRARGSQVTDIVVLVVAADDGAMPQTIESINHAKAAGVKVVVAVNKIDKQNANPDIIKNQLSEHGLVSEEWGGDTMFVYTSALKKTGIKELLDAILVQAEVMELKADPNKAGRGVVIEARLDKGMGPVATMVTQSGTIKIGDYAVAGTTWGRIRMIRDARGANLKELKPGLAGELFGLDAVPSGGDHVYCFDTEAEAIEIVEHRVEKQRVDEENASKKGVTLDDIMQQISNGMIKELLIILKADTQGSIEALKTSLINLSDEAVAIKIIHSSTGAVTLSDVNLALASGAVIIGFNIRPESKAMAEAERVKVDMRYYSIIYECLEDIEKVKTCMLEPTKREKINGRAQIRQVFNISKLGTIAGCIVSDGKIIRNSQIRVIRDGVVAYEGKIKSLKRFKDDTREVAAGNECGIGVDGYNDLKVGDILESFIIEKVSPLAAATSSNSERVVQ